YPAVEQSAARTTPRLERFVRPFHLATDLAYTLGDRRGRFTLDEPRGREEDQRERFGPEDRLTLHAGDTGPQHASHDHESAQRVERVAPLLVSRHRTSARALAKQPEREDGEHREENRREGVVKISVERRPPGQLQRIVGRRRRKERHA